VALPHGAALLALAWEDVVASEPLRSGFELPALQTSVAEARRRVRDQMRGWAFPSDVCDTAQLLVSELVTNAVVHTDTESVECRLRAMGRRVRIEVCDRGSQTSAPLPCWASPDDEHGRGLLLVDTLSDEWGVDSERHRPGRVVWVTLGVPAS
jgi:anti-sigma regulatory factor (Ser/Thr protein kinase)